jgi:hypothetical protein
MRMSLQLFNLVSNVYISRRFCLSKRLTFRMFLIFRDIQQLWQLVRLCRASERADIILADDGFQAVAEPLPAEQPILPQVPVEDQPRPGRIQEEQHVIEVQPLPEAPIEESQQNLATPEPLQILLNVPDTEEHYEEHLEDAVSDEPPNISDTGEHSEDDSLGEVEPAARRVEEHLEDAVSYDPLSVPIFDSDSEEERASGSEQPVNGKQSSNDEESSEEEFHDTLGLGAQEQVETDTHDNEKSAEIAAELPKTVCTACQEFFLDKDLAAAPCNHYYCRTCLQKLFTLSFTDEQLFPPACCEPIPLESVMQFLTPEIEGQFCWKNIEFNTKDRKYCSNPQCGQFLFPGAIEGVWEYCFDCKTKTCSMCKKEYHYGKTPNDCEQDLATEELKALAAQEGWQQCPNCNRMVELTDGCFHMRFMPLNCYFFNVLTYLDAPARRISVMSAKHHGRLAVVHGGTRAVLWLVRSKSCVFGQQSQSLLKRRTRKQI